MKKHCLLVFLLCIAAGNLLAGGVYDVKQIPDLEAPIEIPRALIGDFEFVYEDPYGIDDDFYGWIEIHETNKYIWWRSYGREWGYIIGEDGDYYFSPLSDGYTFRRGYYIRKETKITILEGGFSFICSGMENDGNEFVTVRKREDSYNKPRKLPNQ
jgi:hypothetical protein